MHVLVSSSSIEALFTFLKLCIYIKYDVAVHNAMSDVCVYCTVYCGEEEKKKGLV